MATLQERLRQEAAEADKDQATGARTGQASAELLREAADRLGELGTRLSALEGMFSSVEAAMRVVRTHLDQIAAEQALDDEAAS